MQCNIIWWLHDGELCDNMLMTAKYRYQHSYIADMEKAALVTFKYGHDLASADKLTSI